MANHKSALKRARQNNKRRERNNTIRSAAKTSVKGTVTAIATSKSKDEALKALALGAKALEKAVSKGVLPKNRVSRKISRLAVAINKKFSASEKRA